MEFAAVAHTVHKEASIKYACGVEGKADQVKELFKDPVSDRKIAFQIIYQNEGKSDRFSDPFKGICADPLSNHFANQLSNMVNGATEAQIEYKL